MLKEEVKKLFSEHSQADSWEIANALRSYFKSQSYYKKKKYIPVKKELEIISAAKQIFSASSTGPIPQEHQVEEPGELSSLLNSGH